MKSDYLFVVTCFLYGMTEAVRIKEENLLSIGEAMRNIEDRSMLSIGEAMEGIREK